MIQKNNSLSVYIPKQSELFENEPQNSAGKDKQVDVFNGKHDRYAVIEASAGTGKTFALVELVLELVLEQEIPLKSILLVTFTEKATAELRLRLRKKLRELLEACEKNSASFQTIPEGPFWEINSVRKKQLKAAFLDFDSVPFTRFTDSANGFYGNLLLKTGNSLSSNCATQICFFRRCFGVICAENCFHGILRFLNFLHFM